MSQRFAITIAITPPTALDTVAGRVAERPETEVAGIFFALIHLDDIAAITPWVPSFLQFLEDTYYQAMMAEPAPSIEQAIGITRQRARTQLQQMARETRADSISSLGFCIGALQGRDVSLAHNGNVRALLLHEMRRAGSLEPSYRWIDITKAQSEGHESAIASTVVSGMVSDNDTLFVTTESVTDSLSLEKLQRTMGSVPLEGARSIIERQLKTIGGRRSFGTLLLRPTTRREPTPEQVTTSMNTLTEREAGTSTLLVQAGAKSWKNVWQKIRTKTPTNPRSAPAAAPSPVTQSRARSMPAPLQRSTRPVGWQLGQFVRRLASAIGAVVALLIITPLRLALSFFNNRQERLALVGRERQRIDAFLTTITTRLRRLPHTAQRMLVIALLFAFLFVQSLVFLADRRSRGLDTSTNRSLAAAIQANLDEAESDLIFGNNQHAIGLLSDANTKLNDLTGTSRTDQAVRDLLMKKLQELSAKIERVVNVDAPTTVANVTSATFTTPLGVVLANGTLVVYGEQVDRLMTVPLTTNQVTETTIVASGVGVLRQALVSDAGQAVFLHADKGVANLDLTAATLTGVPMDEAIENPTALSFYNSRLYLLDAGQNQIWRYQLSGGRYTNRSPWLKGNVGDLSAASGLTVDGTIYLLLKDGHIKKYASGTEQAWNMEMPFGSNNNVTRLQSTADGKNLYALDATRKRVIVWEKESGRLLAQYAFPTASKLLDFAADEKGNTLYVLTDTAILKTSFTNP